MAVGKSVAPYRPRAADIERVEGLSLMQPQEQTPFQREEGPQEEDPGPFHPKRLVLSKGTTIYILSHFFTHTHQAPSTFQVRE